MTLVTQYLFNQTILSLATTRANIMWSSYERHSEVWDGSHPFRFLTPQELAQVQEFDQLIVDYVNSIQINK